MVKNIALCAALGTLGLNADVKVSGMIPTTNEKWKGLSMKPLYEIAGDIGTILNSEEWTDEQLDAIDALSLDLAVKVGSIAAFRTNLSGFVDACKVEEKRIAARRKAAETRMASLLDYTKKCIELAGREEIQCGTITAKIQKNPPCCVIDDEDIVPGKYKVIVPATSRIDKKLLMVDIKAGVSVPGVHKEQSTRLAFK